MIRHILASGRVRIASACFVLSVVLLASTITMAIRPPRLQSARKALELPELRRASEADDSAPSDIIEHAVDRDPFSSSWRQPMLTTAAPASAPLITPDSLRLVGTVVDSSGGSFVLCQIGATSIRVLRVGQELGIYQLHSVSQGSAVFVTNDGHRLELRVPKSGI